MNLSDSNGGMDGVGKTDATVKAYLCRGRQLWQRAARECRIDPDKLQPTEFLAWLELLLPTLKPASRRQYIAGSREHLKHLIEFTSSQSGVPDELESVIRKVSRMQSSHYASEVRTRPWRGNTSSQKAKRIDLGDWEKLFSEANSMRSKWIRPAMVWMGANIMVGLRPSEWRQACLNEAAGKINLVVVNGKNTNGRAHGEMRHLDLSDFSPLELKCIRLQILTASQYAKDDASWNAYYEGVRKAIHRITRKCLPSQRKYPTLYSTRHQFAADAKSSGKSKVEIAALMGHATDSTAECHYGKKKHGNGGCRVKANSQEVEKIRVRFPAYSTETDHPVHGKVDSRSVATRGL